ncbi:LacI family DNA-binding transcriptional regulator [Klebsiella quasipneumoniae]|uniref:LacI family DNA-binding transcriptional regulator n=1 Tax=Klebsiella quasipneumoniae TaxID=1463165 RepID=UPI003F6E03FC
MNSKTFKRDSNRRIAPSSSDVARLAGVSQSTVSRVYSGANAVTDNTRQRVLAAAKELNYQPNALPAMLQTGRSGLVAVVMGGFYNPVYAEMLRCITRALREKNLEAVLVEADSDASFDDLVGKLSRYRIDGAISLLGIRSPGIAARLDRLGIPVVAVNSRKLGNIRTVSTSNRAMGSTAANVLVDKGCRHLAYLAGRKNPSQHQRQSSFIKALVSKGLPQPRVVQAGFTYEEGYKAAEILYETGERPDGIFCVNDLAALGAIDAIKHKFGLCVPEDVQIIGCDDIAMGAWCGYGLSSFATDWSALARACVSLLDDSPTATAIDIPSQLILRGTTL